MIKLFECIRQGSKSYTTRKPAKTNRITDVIFSSVILTDGNNSISNSVGIYRQHNSVGDPISIYRRHIFVGIYQPYRLQPIQFVWIDVTVW
jgi:hypothetical protein